MSQVRIELVTKPEDLVQGFDCVCEAFGRQTRDAIWGAMNPGWDTAAGRGRGAARFVKRWQGATKDCQGQANTIFLKATAPDTKDASQERVVGIAIWVQLSTVDGYGDRPSSDLHKDLDLEELYPGNQPEQRFLCQVLGSLHARRQEFVKEKSSASPPSLMVLDLCAVDPAYQRRGIAAKLVQWGLDEAKRRGGLEATTEASSMGRHVYAKLGFRQEGPEIPYTVDEEFRQRDLPSNIFMRTGA